MLQGTFTVMGRPTPALRYDFLEDRFGTDEQRHQRSLIVYRFCSAHLATCETVAQIETIIGFATRENITNFYLLNLKKKAKLCEQSLSCTEDQKMQV